MLRIDDDMLDVVHSMRSMLSRRLRSTIRICTAATESRHSVVLNVAEGSGSFGRMRTARYRTALGSARETLACLRVAEAFGYVQTVPAELGADEARRRHVGARRCVNALCARARSRARAEGAGAGAGAGAPRGRRSAGAGAGRRRRRRAQARAQVGRWTW